MCRAPMMQRRPIVKAGGRDLRRVAAEKAGICRKCGGVQLYQVAIDGKAVTRFVKTDVTIKANAKHLKIKGTQAAIAAS